MNIKLSDNFTYKKLLWFSFPSIIMMVVQSIYSVVDGFFVSNFVGKTPFAAVNFIMPILMIMASFGFMFGTGGSAIVAKTMGEGDDKKANELFSLFVFVAMILGIILGVIGFIFMPFFAAMLGAKGEMLKDCIIYARIILIALPFYLIMFEFQSFFVTAEKPNFGLIVTIISGVTNMVFDALFIIVFKWGLAGAAIATTIGQIVGCVVSLLYFLYENDSLLRLTKTVFDGDALLKVCINGSSELVANISISFVSMLYNVQLMKYAGENGVAAYGVLMYVNMIFLNVFFGYCIGSAPVISYHYGAKNQVELKNLLKKSIVIIVSFSICMFCIAQIFSSPLAKIFVSYDKKLLELTLRGFMIFSFSFFFAGVSIFGSSFFTALNNGVVSALISLLRTFIFQFAAVLLLPLLIGVDGIWLSIVLAEFMSVVITLFFIMKMRGKYNYI